MTFQLAIDALRSGKKIARDGWRDTDTYLKNALPYDCVNRHLPYIFIHTEQGGDTPWTTATQADMLADDWFVKTE